MGKLGTHYEIEDLGGGKFRHTQHLKAIAYSRNGILRRITNQLGNTGDVNLPLGTDELCQFRVRDKLSGNAPVVHFGKGQSHVRWTPLNTANVLATVSGNSVTYPNAWPNADLRLSIAGHILHKDIPLRAGHPASFQFRLDAHQNFNVDTLSSEEFQVLPPILLGPQMQSIPLTWAKSVQGGKTVLTVTLPPGDYAGWTLDPTVTLQPDATDGLDTLLDDRAATTNYGTLADWYIGDGYEGALARSRGLITFVLTSIPATVTVTTATLSLFEYASSDTAGTGSWAVTLHRVLPNWVEAQATWNIYSTGNNWTTAGADSDGNDRVAVASATLTLDGTAANDFVSWSSATLANDVQKMRNGTYDNYGWLIQAPTAEAVAGRSNSNFRASDTATAANRPTLAVEYVVSSGALYRRFMMTR